MLLGQAAATNDSENALVNCSRFPKQACQANRSHSPKIATTRDGERVKLNGDAVRFARNGYNVVRGIHFTESTRFAVLIRNASGVLAGNIYENTGRTRRPERAYLNCGLQVIAPGDNRVDTSERVALLKTPRNELGCWMWPAAFPGDILGDDRGNKLFFSNIAVASVGVLANRGRHRVKISNSMFRDFSAGLVTDGDGAEFGFAEGAEAILLSTDDDAHVDLNIRRVDIKNRRNLPDERGPRVANCTYAAIFTQHHDTSSANVALRHGAIREIGGCDGVNNHIGFLPGVKSGELQVRLFDSNGKGEYAIGPQHTAQLHIDWLDFHIINTYEPSTNDSNKFTDAFEPIISEHVDAVSDSNKRSTYSLNMRRSTIQGNSGNGIELRFGADRIERIPLTTQAEIDQGTLSIGPLSLDARVRIRNSCIFNNAQADDVFSEGSNAVNGRDNLEGRDYHDVHVYFPVPQDLNYRIDARKNFWGVRDRHELYSPVESEDVNGQELIETKIIAINSDDLGVLPPQTSPVTSSSFVDVHDLDTAFDTRNIKTNPSSCFRGVGF